MSLYLLNTIQQAQEAYQAIKAKGFDGELLLFHARFPAGQRDQIEQRCVRLFGKEKTARPRKAILVATQVVEQSLDVDFDVMMTSIAPIDLLLQRLGREFRHEDTPRPPHFTVPRFYVLIPSEPGKFETDGYVYPECLLQQSIHLLEERSEIRIPEDLPTLVEQGYNPEAAPPGRTGSLDQSPDGGPSQGGSQRKLYNQYPEKGYTPINESEEIQFDDLENNSYLSAKTRLGEPTVRIALLPPEQFNFFATESTARGPAISIRGAREEAQEILKASVSVRAKLLRPRKEDILVGRKLLEGVKIYPAAVDGHGKMWYTQEDGSHIFADCELGIYFEKG